MYFVWTVPSHYFASFAGTSVVDEIADGRRSKGDCADARESNVLSCDGIIESA